MIGALRIRGAEAIAHARLGHDELRACGVGFDLSAELRDIDTQILALPGILGALNRAQDHAMRQRLVGVLHEVFEQVVFGRGQVLLFLVMRQTRRLLKSTRRPPA